MPKSGKDVKKAEKSTQASEKLRVQQPNAIRSILTAPSSSLFRVQLKRLELVEKLPLKLYEELAAFLGNKDDGLRSGFPCLEVLSLADSCCGDAALLVGPVAAAVAPTGLLLTSCTQLANDQASNS
jgi:hypothetical protein